MIRKSPLFHFAVAMVGLSGIAATSTVSVLLVVPSLTVSLKVNGLFVIGYLYSG